MFARLRFRSDIVSDCQGAIKTQKARVGRRLKGIRRHITAQNVNQSVRERTEARCVKSHSELDKSKSGRWSTDGWRTGGWQGNDRGHLQRQDHVLANGDRWRSPHHGHGQQRPEQNAHHHTGGNGVLLDPIRNVVYRRCFDKYCEARDGYRAKAFKPPKWVDCNSPWARMLYGTNKSQSVIVKTTYTKIICGKRLHGGNLLKITVMIRRGDFFDQLVYQLGFCRNQLGK